MIGSLFIRTYERGERVHQAMMSRGYRGTPTAVEGPRSRHRDRLALAITILFALLGHSIYVLR
jgi:cobalt/nickel transport system permease protein